MDVIKSIIFIYIFVHSRPPPDGPQEADQGREVVLPDAGRASREGNPERVRAGRERGLDPEGAGTLQGWGE